MVIHRAALIVVPDSVADPVGYYRANIVTSLEFIAHLLRNGCARLIFSSSAAIYRASEDLTVDEESPVDPQSPYARTKAICEAMFADIAVWRGRRAGPQQLQPAVHRRRLPHRFRDSHTDSDKKNCSRCTAGSLDPVTGSAPARAVSVL